MQVPFSWQPTGWFMIGWSAEFESEKVSALKYLGHEMVAWRTEAGELHVLDAHCPHLGAHLGHGGKVVDDCVRCPFHGWEWGADGVNKRIPYEERPNVSKTIRTWPVRELNECVYIWHDPAGGEPRWELPDIFRAWDDLCGSPDDYYRAFPEASIKYTAEPVHPAVVLENAADSMHFKHIHHSQVTPRLLSYEIVGPEFCAVIGWPNPKNPEGDEMSLSIRSISSGLGNAFNCFEGAVNYRVMISTTPVDDEVSDLFSSIWWPRGSDTSLIAPEEVVKMIGTQFLTALEEDLEIWRYQVYVEHPALAKIDAKPFGALRKWVKQFYEIPLET